MQKYGITVPETASDGIVIVWSVVVNKPVSKETPPTEPDLKSPALAWLVTECPLPSLFVTVIVVPESTLILIGLKEKFSIVIVLLTLLPGIAVGIVVVVVEVVVVVVVVVETPKIVMVAVPETKLSPLLVARNYYLSTFRNRIRGLIGRLFTPCRRKCTVNISAINRP